MASEWQPSRSADRSWRELPLTRRVSRSATGRSSRRTVPGRRNSASPASRGASEQGKDDGEEIVKRLSAVRDLHSNDSSLPAVDQKARGFIHVQGGLDTAIGLAIAKGASDQLRPVCQAVRKRLSYDWHSVRGLGRDIADQTPFAISEFRITGSQEFEVRPDALERRDLLVREHLASRASGVRLQHFVREEFLRLEVVVKGAFWNAGLIDDFLDATGTESESVEAIQSCLHDSVPHAGSHVTSIDCAQTSLLDVARRPV